MKFGIYTRGNKTPKCSHHPVPFEPGPSPNLNIYVPVIKLSVPISNHCKYAFWGVDIHILRFDGGL